MSRAGKPQYPSLLIANTKSVQEIWRVAGRLAGALKFDGPRSDLPWHWSPLTSRWCLLSSSEHRKFALLFSDCSQVRLSNAIVGLSNTLATSHCFLSLLVIRSYLPLGNLTLHLRWYNLKHSAVQLDENFQPIYLMDPLRQLLKDQTTGARFWRRIRRIVGKKGNTALCVN